MLNAKSVIRALTFDVGIPYLKCFLRVKSADEPLVDDVQNRFSNRAKTLWA
jgi:hypothetical protein